MMVIKLMVKLHPGMHIPGFSLGRLHMGDLSPPYGSAGGQSINGGTHEGGHGRYGGDLILIDYIIN